jgi:surface antigen
VTIIAKGKCDKGVRAIRIKVDGNVLEEIGAPELRVEWRSPVSPADHSIEAEIAGVGDNQWTFAGRRSIAYVLSDGTQLTSTPESPQEPGRCRYSWVVGNQVALDAGAEIRRGPGLNFDVHTRVPQNDWLVEVLDGPRQSSDGIWFDVSRATLDGGGSGWVEFSQANYSGCISGQPAYAPGNSSETTGDTSGNNGSSGSTSSTNSSSTGTTSGTGNIPSDPESGQQSSLDFKYTISCQQPQQQDADSGDSVLDSVKNFLRDLFNIQVQAARTRPFDEGECTQLAAKLAPESLTWLPNTLAYAHAWDDYAREAGYDVDDVPRMGDLVNWESNCGASVDGHVGYVVTVDDENNRVLVAEQNVPIDAGPRVHAYDLDAKCMNFIHLPDPIPAKCTQEYTASPLKIEKGKLLGFVPRYDYVLEIPVSSLSGSFEIYYQGEVVPDDDGGIRHDGFHEPISEGNTYLGISTLWTWRNRDWEDASKWKVHIPCD